MADTQLAAGDDMSDKKLDHLQVALANLFDLKPEDYASTKVKPKMTWLDTVAELINPMSNPASYRSCQDSAVAKDLVPLLLGLATHATSDGARSKSAEVLARMSFGNSKAAEAIATNPGFLPAVQVMLGGSFPEQLGAMQLAQAVSASSSTKVVEVVPALVVAVTPKLTDLTFASLPMAALEVMISASFHDPAAVAGAAPLSFYAATVDEGEGRPSWNPLEPLQVLVCGMLATNLLSLDLSSDAASRDLMAGHLTSGAFVEHVLCALEASASRKAWPVDTGVFHAPGRLTKLVRRLSEQGHNKRLIQAIQPLISIVQNNVDDETTNLALQALRALGQDVTCLESLLAESAFRTYLEEELHTSGQVPESTELISYLDTVEGLLTTAQTAYEGTKLHIANAPDVRALSLFFTDMVGLDQELPPEQLLPLLSRLPVGPAASIQASLSGGSAKQSLSFDSLAQRLYGTPTVLGWWPSLMQDTAALWVTRAEGSRLPALVRLVEVFELGTKGKSSITSQVILDELLPAMGLPIEGTVVEIAFAELRGDKKLDLKAFAEWLMQLEKALMVEEAEEAAAAQEAAAREKAALETP